MVSKLLKQKLLDSLSAIQDVSDGAKRINRITQAISNVIIPEKDYLNVAHFIFLLVTEQPSIMEHYPQNQLLRSLFLECEKQQKLLEELRTKTSPSNRRS